MKLLGSYKYWILNFIGWILFALLMLTIDKITYGRNVSNVYMNYVIAEGVLCGFLGFILSFVILFFVEKYFDIGNYSKTDIYKLVGVVILTQIIYHILLWPLLNVPMNYYFQRSNSLTLIQKLSNVPHFLAYYLVWLFVILTLKFVHHINTIKVNQLKLEANLKDAQLNTLKGQINPHFMFNSLNNIRGLMLEDVNKARNMLTSLSETLRYSLTKNGINSISLEDELEMVENYIEVSKIQFEDRLDFETQIDEKSIDKQIPPMIIQILIENAIKHGISTLKRGGKVKLTTLIEADQLYIEVANTGHIRHAENSTYLGLENIKQRLKLLYGTNALFTLNEIGDKVVATIKIPLG
ncbi:MAG: histidine kinase [Winogradskyella sp.]|uniref:sensor histidine kinase n=1 Tax=Winogradskyella sp. TaxID=1883156 RepID=UPI0025DDD822|nr:histidine kinase [Winogradskyella sp.]NRB83331.1 histidine kinase [Winogradskyella sp.]